MGKITETELAGIINDKTFQYYLDNYKMLAISLFQWNNLNDICGYGANTFIETALYEMGKGCFVKDTELGYMVLNANPNGYYNTNNVPTSIMATSVGYNKEYNIDDIVYIKNNEIEKPTFSMLELFAYRLYEIDRTIDVNMFTQKYPAIIEGDSKSILTLKNIMMKYSGNIPLLYGRKNFNINNKLNSIKFDAPYLIDKLDLHKQRVINESLTILGINNSNTDKKERLITNEVDSNNQLISYYLNCFYKCRKQACDMINEKFLKNSDKKLSISLNKDVLDLLKFTENDIINNEEVKNNGEIHNNN